MIEVEEMIKSAEKHSEEDKKHKEKIDTINLSETLVHTTEKTLKENGDKLDKEQKTKIESDVKALKEALKGEKIDDI